jgi:transcriptional regulator with XRE-family HTH domain
MEKLPELIKELREMGMTQAEIASAAHLSQAHISNIENGKRGSRTPVETIERVVAVRDQKREELRSN